MEIQSLQVSPLAGRVFFKGFRYYGRNETILVQDGHVTWRYWLRRVQELDGGVSADGIRTDTPHHPSDGDSATGSSSGEGESTKSKHHRELPCRVVIKVRGAQWYVYNRSPAFDAILRSILGQNELKQEAVQESSEPQRSGEMIAEKPETSPDDDSRNFVDSRQDSTVEDRIWDAVSIASTMEQVLPSNEPEDPRPPSLLNILPIGLTVGKAAAVMGNHSTRSILVAKTDGVNGKFTAQPTNPLDLYKQVIDLDFTRPTVQFKHNKDYKNTLCREGVELRSKNGPTLDTRPSWYDRWSHQQSIRHANQYLKKFIPHRRSSVDAARHPRPNSNRKFGRTSDDNGEYGHSKWLGLTRYLDEDDDILEHERWMSIEYAQVPNILDCPSLSMSFHWDVPGAVPEQRSARTHSPSNSVNDINGDAPPDWGIDLKIRGGTINYGPWADRQRIDLQNAFFPALHHDAKPAKKLSAGVLRMSTKFKMFIVLEEKVVLRVPSREGSKDWKWRGKVTKSATTDSTQKRKLHGKNKKGGSVSQGPNSRPFGWIDVKILQDSTISLVMDLVADANGYRNYVETDLKGIELYSSINHALFWRSQSQIISCDLSNPLGWNTKRKWHIRIQDSSLELFILRDHMFLLTDLINDWTSGPDAEFYTFIPYEYALSLYFVNFKLYLNTNDSNIIDSPTEIAENAFLVIQGQDLSADILIPTKDYRPSKNKVEFNVNAQGFNLTLLTPHWNTQHTFLEDGNLGTMKDLKLTGSYNYHSTTSSTLTDTLVFKINGETLTVQLYGFLIRYFMNVIRNYFGDDMHFRTLEEYQRQRDFSSLPHHEETNAEQHHRPSNDLDVILMVEALGCLGSIPASLYSAKENIKLEILSVSVDLRITNYYMDLAVSSSPILVSHGDTPVGNNELIEDESHPQMFFEGLEVYGHRLFGLPASEPTYVCNWDFEIGRIDGECSVDFLRSFLLAIQCFALSFDDQENALPPVSQARIYDVTFLRSRVNSFTLALRVEEAAVILSTKSVTVDMNDWAGRLFSDRAHAFVSDLTIAITDSKGAVSRRHGQHLIAKTYAYINTDLEINHVGQKSDLIKHIQLQQDYITLHDSRTHRAPWLIRPKSSEHPSKPASIKSYSRPPAMPSPLMPEPVVIDHHKSISNGSSSPSASSSRYYSSSFLAKTTQSKYPNHRNRNAKLPRADEDVEQCSPVFHSFPMTHQSSQSGTTSDTSGLAERHNTKASKAKRVLEEKGEQHGFTFSSPFKRPYFPLTTIVPDTTDVPVPPSVSDRDDVEFDGEVMAQLEAQSTNSNAEHSGTFINFGQGVRALCTPKALILVTQIQDQMQTGDITSILDDLHIQTIRKVLALNKKSRRGASSTDAQISISYFGIKFVSAVDSDLGGSSHRELYDLVVQNTSITLRSAARAANASNSTTDEELALHMLVDQISFTAKESRLQRAADQAIISIHTHQPTLWLLQGSRTLVELHVGDFEITSASRRVDYVSSLISRTTIMAEDLTSRLTTITQKHRSRLQMYILLLAEEGYATPNPPFLSGASYVLRSATNHLRTTDSWRMIARLRYIQSSLPNRSIKGIRDRCENDWASCPEDAALRAFSTFRKWHIWDIKNAESSVLLENIYNTTSTSSAVTSLPTKSLRLSIRARRLRLVVEPGLSQNEVVVERCLFGITANRDSQDALTHGHNLTITTISTYCSKFVVRLNWSLCDLVENIAETMQHLHTPMRSKDHTRSNSQTVKRSCIHIVISSEMSILNIDTINLKAITICKALKVSVVRLLTGNVHSRGSTSLVMDAAVVKTDVHSSSSILSTYNLHQPRLFGSQDVKRREGPSKPWRFVGSGDRISFQLLKTPLELVEVVDNFIQDEVAHLIKWVKSFPISKATVSQSRRSEGPPKAHVTLLLDSYLLSLMILPTLVYQIQGVGVRSSIQTGMSQPSVIVMNIDLKEHSHLFESNVKGDSLEISTLKLPPISGNLKLDLAPEHNMVSFRYLVEYISVSAHSLHAIVDAVNQPAIVHLGKELKHEIPVIQKHIQDLFETDMPQKLENEQPPTPLLFDAKATIMRLTIHAATPESPTLGQAAELDIDLGRIFMRGTNIENHSGRLMPIPELYIQLNTIRVELLRPEDLDFQSCGKLSVNFSFTGTSRTNEAGEATRSFLAQSSSLDLSLYTKTAAAALAILGHLQDTLKTIDLPTEVKELQKLGRNRLRREGLLLSAFDGHKANDSSVNFTFSPTCSLLMADIRVAWKIGDAIPLSPTRQPEDLVFSIRKVDLTTRQNNAGRLLIENMQLQMSPPSQAIESRSLNSALLPEIVFNVAYRSTQKDRRLAFQAVGKSLDIQLTSESILPANDLRRSIASAAEQVRTASQHWKSSIPVSDGRKNNLFSDKKLSSLLIYADFAGAVVHIQGRSVIDPQSKALSLLRGGRPPQHGKYNQFTADNSNNSSATLRSPGMALKIEYLDSVNESKSINAEMKVFASSNTLFPTVVLLVKEITSSIKEIVGETDEVINPEQRKESKVLQPKFIEDERLRTADAGALLGNCKLNIGLRICKQEFTLSCQPIARVAAQARFQDVYFTLNTVQSVQHGKFFSLSAAFTGLQMSVQHVYSRESTGSFDVESIVVSFMNSRHISSANGISAILRISPMKAQINAKQLQDFLLFRDIWVPPGDEHDSSQPKPGGSMSEPQVFIMQRYQQIAATGTFPWNATVSIEDLDVYLDLGSSLGRSNLKISEFWITSRKSSGWKQNLYLGFGKVAVNSTGRMSGFTELQNFKVRTSIHWPVVDSINDQTPLVQASVSFDHVQIKAGFDFQSFLIADISALDFLMYNVQDPERANRDRLVGVLEGDKVQVFCTSTSASQGLALYQAFQRLVEEKKKSYEAALSGIEKFLRRKSSIPSLTVRTVSSRQPSPKPEPQLQRSPLQLQTNVVVALRAVNLGAFPGTFIDNQIFKFEALETSARFSVVLDQTRIHSTLGMALGQLRVALSSVNRDTIPKTLEEVTVADVVASATGSRGGTILKVPRLIATMQTWQEFESTHIDYTFQSSFQGKVDVGWNYSRISYIRGMHANHTRTLAQRLGKPLPQSAVKITGLEGEDDTGNGKVDRQEKITAVVDVPQSKYNYTALQPPVIETPQLRDMGEATPPLEWIGLQRDRLPHLTHQIVIVTLLEVAKEVDDAYSKILGSS